MLGGDKVKRRRLTDDEKASLVHRSLQGETLADISRDTGIHAILLSRWRKEYRDNGHFGHRKETRKDVVVTFQEAQSEIRHLKRQLEDRNLEISVLRDMLKKNETSDR